MSFGKRSFRLFLFAAVAILAAALVSAGPLFAQEVSAGVTGRVTDPSGAAIANATVTMRDQERGTSFPTTTNADGVYAFPRIPIGLYELKVEAPGFKAYVEGNIRLEMNQRARRDIQMEIGAVTESVQVTAEGAILQTETTQVGAVIAPTTIVNAPLLTRNFIALTLLAPGVTTPDPSSFISGQRTSGGGRPYVNGNRKEANNFLLDGIDNNLQSDNLTAYQPNLDAIQEFKMITNNASAEFGNFQGGIINVSIKSGTNDLHGTAFEFFRNDKLNANNWGRNWSLAPGPDGKAPRPFLRWNEFGGTLGGAVKKDKLFFFADYQGIRRASPGSPGSISVIPASFRTGDFSRLLSERGRQLYNPFTTSSTGVRDPFLNNQIPLSLIDPAARNLFSSPDLYPLPINNGLTDNQINVGSGFLNTDQGDIKLDYKPTDKDYFSVRYSNGRQDVPGVNTFPLFYNSFNTAPFSAGVLNWTRTIGPNLVNEARAGVNNVTLNNGGEDKGLGTIAQKLGIQGVPTGLMGINFTNGLASGLGSQNIGTQQLFANTTWHYADNVTIIHGRHMMKTGGNVLRQWVNAFYAGNNGRTGFITFNGQFTQGPNANSPAAGSGFAEADFFLGYPSRLGRGLSTGTWGHRKTIWGFYFQDDWRATDSLTLNLGLRWEYHTPLVEVKDRQSNFAPFTGKLLLPGQDGEPRSLYHGFKKDFQPRIGFAWTPAFLGKKTVFRGAYTISSFMEGSGTNLRLPLNPPFNTEFETIYEGQTAFGTTTDQGLTVLKSADPYKGINVRLWDQFVRPANVQQWNFTVEEQLPFNNILSVGYVGQHGTHLIVPMPYFQKQLLPDGTTRPSPYLSGNPLLANIAQISGTESDGNQRYDSLQVQLRKRLSAGLEYNVSYTWSHGMSDAIGYYGEGGQAGSQSAYWQYLYDRRAEWGPTYFDARHMFVGSYVYDLPLGKGKKWGSSMHPVANGVLGNWQLGGILTLHTGFPLTIQDSDRSGTTSRGPRANCVGDSAGPEAVGPGAKWFNLAAFQPTRTGTLGNCGVGTVRGPGLSRFDFSVQKKFPVTEAKWFEFRSEFYNLTNTPAFNGPTRNVNSALFGEIRSSQGERNIQLALKFYF